MGCSANVPTSNLAVILYKEISHPIIAPARCHGWALHGRLQTGLDDLVAVLLPLVGATVGALPSAFVLHVSCMFILCFSKCTGANQAEQLNCNCLGQWVVT